MMVAKMSATHTDAAKNIEEAFKPFVMSWVNHCGLPTATYAWPEQKLLVRST